MPLEDLLRNQDRQRVQAVNTNNEAYRKRARELEEIAEKQKKICKETIAKLNTIQAEKNANHDLAERVKDHIKQDIFLPNTLNDANLETLKLIHDFKLPELAIANIKPQAFKSMIELSRKRPDILPINISLLDDQIDIREDDPTASKPLALWDRALSQSDPTIQEVIMQQIVRDMKSIAQGKDFAKLLKAISLRPDLVNLSLPQDPDDPLSPKTPTPAMYLAEHNQLVTLQEIENTIRAATKTPPETEIPPAYNFFKKTDEHGDSIVHYALREGHKDLALWLVEKGQLALSPLEAAAKAGNAAEVKSLLNNDPQGDPTEHYQAPLMWAVVLGHQEVVKELLASTHYAANEAVSAQENIAVITAIRYGYLGNQYLDIATMLIAKGADICDQDELAFKFINSLTPSLTGLAPEQLNIRQAICRDFLITKRPTSQIFKARIQQFSTTEKQARMQLQTTEEEARTAIKNIKQSEAETIEEKSKRFYFNTFFLDANDNRITLKESDLQEAQRISQDIKHKICSGTSIKWIQEKILAKKIRILYMNLSFEPDPSDSSNNPQKYLTLRWFTDDNSIPLAEIVSQEFQPIFKDIADKLWSVPSLEWLKAKFSANEINKVQMSILLSACRSNITYMSEIYDIRKN